MFWLKGKEHASEGFSAAHEDGQFEGRTERGQTREHSPPAHGS